MRDIINGIGYVTSFMKTSWATKWSSKC